jgi:plastocyanin
MKHLNLLLVGLICGLLTSAYSETFNVTHVGYTYSPDSITAHVGDSVVFTLGQYHNMVEVDKSTWEANGNTPNGGFALPFGGGVIVLVSADTIYYVCTPHASMGMKGKIIVLPGTVTSFDVQNKSVNQLRVFPNPVRDLLSINFYAPENTKVTIDLLDITGQTIKHLYTGEYLTGNNTETVNMQDLNPGYYFVRFNSQHEYAIARVLKP